MSDLISREEVLQLIENIKCNNSLPKNYGTLLDILMAVRKIQTAFDVSKLVEQLETYKSIMKTNSANSGHDGMASEYYRGRMMAAVDFLEIVKGGITS